MNTIASWIARGAIGLMVLLPAILVPVIALQYANNTDSTDVVESLQQQVITPTISADMTVESDTEASTEPAVTPDEDTAAITATNTLRPPPTFAPPTNTPTPTTLPSITPPPTFDINVNLPDINGLEPTPTAQSEPGCELREDWGLEYNVQPNDTVAAIAARYNTDQWQLADANCLADMNQIYIGQRLRVPGEAHPVAPQYVCLPYEILTPIDWAVAVPHTSQVTFNWRGTQSERNLLRILDMDGNIVYEQTVDLRQNVTISMSDLPDAGGTYQWYVYPLNLNYLQIPCPEGGPWHFGKQAAPATP